MVLVLKIVCNTSTSSEIRRVTAIGDVLQSFTSLVWKIQNVFPSLQDKVFSVYWQDDEKDEIIMSSDEELSQAVCQADGTLKLYIKLVEDLGPAIPKLHANVTCDACNRPIKGLRYKCCQCPDFDLCSSCNAMNKHSEHDMIKFVNPVSEGRTWHFPGWRRMWQAMFPYLGICPYAGAEMRSAEGRPGHFDYKKFFDSFSKDNSTNLYETFKALADNFGVSVSMDVDIKDPNKSDKQEAATATAPSYEVVKPIQSSNINEDAVSKLPTNDTSAEAVLPNSESSSTSSVHSVEANVSTSTGNQFRRGMFLGDLPGGWTVLNPEPFTENVKLVVDEKAGEIKGTSYPKIPVEKVPCDSASVNHQNEIPASGTHQNAMPASGTHQNAMPASGVHQNAFRNYPFSFFQKTMSSGNASSQTAPPPAGFQNSTNPTVDPVSLDENIASALAKMMAMGFENENGWLTKLLEAKNGNIADALDSVFPNLARR